MIKKKTERKTMTGHIDIKLTDKDGNVKQHISKHNTFVDAGDAHVADRLDATPGEAAMGWMAVGTSSSAFTVSSTALTKEIDRNALTAGYPEQGAAANDNDVKYKASWATIFHQVVSMPVMA